MQLHLKRSHHFREKGYRPNELLNVSIQYECYTCHSHESENLIFSNNISSMLN